MSVSIYFGSSKHAVYAEEICALIEKAAQQRGTGIAKRDPNYIKTKFENQNAVIALYRDLGKQKICSQFRTGCTPGLQRAWIGKKDQRKSI